MSLLTVMLMCGFLFLLGFYIGYFYSNGKPKKGREKIKKLISLSEEYRNFLNYDGSEQQ